MIGRIFIQLLVLRFHGEVRLLKGEFFKVSLCEKLTFSHSLLYLHHKKFFQSSSGLSKLRISTSSIKYLSSAFSGSEFLFLMIYTTFGTSSTSCSVIPALTNPLTILKAFTSLIPLKMQLTTSNLYILVYYPIPC